MDPSSKTVVGTGQAVLHGKTYSLSNFGFSATANGFIPTGTVTLDAAQPLQLGELTVSGFSGTLNFDGGTASASTFTANGTIKLDLHNGTVVAVQVSGLQLKVPPGAKFDDPSRWTPDLSHATVVPLVSESKIFNHLLEACDPKSLPTPDVGINTDMQFCLGMHLGSGELRDPSDIAYGYAALDKWDNTDRHFHLRDLSFTLPPNHPAVVRFGAGKISVRTLRLDVYHQNATGLATNTLTKYGGFDSSISVDRLDQLYGDDIRVVGSATIDKISIGKEDQDVSAVPRLGFGSGCTIFSLRGGVLPIQLTPQSTMVLTSLAFAHSQARGPSNDELDYLEASGSFTSGNITIVLNSIGFRTFIDKKDGSPHCIKELQEYELHHTRVCAIVNVNLPMTLAASGAQNASTIADLANRAATALFGFVVGKTK